MRREIDVGSQPPPHTPPTQVTTGAPQEKSLVTSGARPSFASSTAIFSPALRSPGVGGVFCCVSAVQGQIHGHAARGEHALRRGAAATTARHCLGLGNPPGALWFRPSVAACSGRKAACVLSRNNTRSPRDGHVTSRLPSGRISFRVYFFHLRPSTHSPGPAASTSVLPPCGYTRRKEECNVCSCFDVRHTYPHRSVFGVREMPSNTCQACESNHLWPRVLRIDRPCASVGTTGGGRS